MRHDDSATETQGRGRGKVEALTKMELQPLKGNESRPNWLPAMAPR